MEESNNNKIILRNIFKNLAILALIILYFGFINFTYIKMEEDIITLITKIASMVLLFLSIIIFEVAYHKDSGRLAINGIEILFLAFHTLTIWHVISKRQLSFKSYLLFSVCAFSIYYILKAIIIYTKGKRDYVKSLSDIHEILNNDPVKKEAKKRKNK